MSPTTEKVLIFEWLCGGGLWIDRMSPNDEGLIDQGSQMLTAACGDFAESGFEVLAPIDSRLLHEMHHHRQLDVRAVTYPVSREAELMPTLLQLAQQADKILIIAPETDNCLLNLLQHLRVHQSKLLNPNEEFTALASNKNRMQAWLSERGIPVPIGASADQWPPSQLPPSNQLVLKPADGCGGQGMELLPAPLTHQDILAAVRSTGFSRKTITPPIPTPPIPPKGGTTNGMTKDVKFPCKQDEQLIRDQQLLRQWRIEEYVEGTPASVSIIRPAAKSSETRILSPLRQVFFEGTPGKFSHCQNDLPIDLATRAQELAKQTVSALPDFFGFIGIDILLGPRDVVIEINPRLTMSYCVFPNCFKQILT